MNIQMAEAYVDPDHETENVNSGHTVPRVACGLMESNPGSGA